jgi:hypothetical protein
MKEPTEDCQFTQGGSFIKFDISFKTILTSPPTLLIDVRNNYFMTFYRIVNFKISSTNSIPSLKLTPMPALSRFKTRNLSDLAHVEHL